MSLSVVAMSDELQLATSMIWPLALASKPRLMSAKAKVSSFVEPTQGKRAQSLPLCSVAIRSRPRSMNADRPSPNSSRATASRKTGTSFESSVDRIASATRSCTPEKSPPKRGGRAALVAFTSSSRALVSIDRIFHLRPLKMMVWPGARRLVDGNGPDGLAIGDDAELFRRRKHGVEIVTGRNPFTGLSEHQRPVRSHLEQRGLGAGHRLEQFGVEGAMETISWLTILECLRLPPS